MIYMEDGTIWVACDKCTLTLFGGFTGEGRMDVINPLIRQGWTFGDKILCPGCSRNKRWSEDNGAKAV